MFGLVYCGQTAGWIKLPLGTEIGLGPGNIVVDGNLDPPKRCMAPQFSAHVYCGQMAVWMKMPLGTEVDLSPGHVVLDVDPALPFLLPPPPARKGHNAPSFWPMSTVAMVAHLSYCWALVLFWP